MGAHPWGPGVGQDDAGAFQGWLTPLVADNLPCPYSGRGPGLSQGLLRPQGWCFSVLLLTGQCGVGVQDAIPSDAGEEKARLLRSP